MAKYPKHIPRFAFDRHASPLNVPLVLNVILVNFGEDAGLQKAYYYHSARDS
jgi:hypothetical protein